MLSSHMFFESWSLDLSILSVIYERNMFWLQPYASYHHFFFQGFPLGSWTVHLQVQEDNMPQVKLLHELALKQKLTCRTLTNAPFWELYSGGNERSKNMTEAKKKKSGCHQSFCWCHKEHRSWEAFTPKHGEPSTCSNLSPTQRTFQRQPEIFLAI